MVSRFRHWSNIKACFTHFDYPHIQLHYLLSENNLYTSTFLRVVSHDRVLQRWARWVIDVQNPHLSAVYSHAESVGPKMQNDSVGIVVSI